MKTCSISVIKSFTVKTDSVNNEAIEGEKTPQFKKIPYIDCFRNVYNSRSSFDVW